MPATFIEKSDINERSRNGGLLRQAIFKENNMKFKYVIKTDSYDDQASAKLYAWTTKEGFELVISKNLKDSYGENPTYTSAVKAQAFFRKVETDMLSIAERFSQ